jgi:hypothetical protein
LRSAKKYGHDYATDPVNDAGAIAPLIYTPTARIPGPTVVGLLRRDNTLEYLTLVESQFAGTHLSMG